MDSVRIALVADIHVGRTRSTIRASEALPLVKKVVEGSNASSVDLLVTLGDNVNSTNPEEDFENLTVLKKALDASTVPVVPLFGNNDLKYLTAEKVAEALDCLAASEIRVINGWTLVFWRPNCDISLERGGPAFTPDELLWLRGALEEATYPTVIFLHAPIDDHATVGNCYFESRPDIASYRNGAAARRIIEQSGKVVLVVAGHVHWNAGSTIDGVHHRTLAALVETFRVDEDVSASWAILELTPNQITMDVKGNEPMTWSAAPRKAHEHWRRPLTREAYLSFIKSHWQNGQARPWDEMVGPKDSVSTGLV